MGKKQFDTNELFDGLTVVPPPAAAPTPPRRETPPASSPSGPTPGRRGRKAMGKDEERISTIVNHVMYNKCKSIADMEGLAIKDVINKGLEMVVTAYEEKHGPVRVKSIRKKGDINNIF